MKIHVACKYRTCEPKITVILNLSQAFMQNYLINFVFIKKCIFENSVQTHSSLFVHALLKISKCKFLYSVGCS